MPKKLHSAAVVALCATLSPRLGAQEPPRSDGPLLYFYANGDDGEERTFVVDAFAETPAVPIGLGRIGVCGRFRDGRLVCRDGWPEACLVTMTPDGRDRQVLVPGGHDSVQPDFVDMQHERVYVRFGSWDGRRGSLRMFEPDGPADGTELLDRVDAVLSRSLDGLFVHRAADAAAELPADDAQAGGELWFVPRQPGGARRVSASPIDLGPIGEWTNVALSPNRRRLALGIQRLDSTGGHVLVLDVITGKVLAAIDGIDISVSRLSSDLPEVELAWRDDHVLRYSRTTPQSTFEWVDHDIRTGEETGTEGYESDGLAHRPPPGHRELSREAAAKIRVDEKGLWYADQTDGGGAVVDPVVAAPFQGWSQGFAGTLQLSPDARAAACLVDGRVLLVDGVHRRVRVVFDGPWLFPDWAPLPTDS